MRKPKRKTSSVVVIRKRQDDDMNDNDDEREPDVHQPEPVSYTHLDVYKRQEGNDAVGGLNMRYRRRSGAVVSLFLIPPIPLSTALFLCFLAANS